MIVFLTLLYVGILFVLTRVKVLPNSRNTWLSIIPYEIIIIVALLIPMQWGAPQGAAGLVTFSVPIVPNVAGKVIEVPVVPNTPLQNGDVLFRIDPVPYQAAVDNLKAQLNLAEIRLAQSKALAEQKAGSVYEVQSFQAQVDGLKAQLSNAEWNLNETVVRAPGEGYATIVALRPGMRVAALPISPVMVFIDTSQLLMGAQIHQIYMRHIRPGQKAEVALKVLPGRVLAATVEAVVQATAQGQAPISGYLPAPVDERPGPMFVRLRLDDDQLERDLPAGAIGTVAIYTDSSTYTHVIRKVMIRMEAYWNFILPM